MPGFNEIIIRFNEKDVIALLNHTPLKGIAKCHPDDIFNLQTGVNLAVSRLIDSMKKPHDGDAVVFDGEWENVNDFMWAREHLSADQIFRYSYNANPSPDLIYILRYHDEKYGVIEQQTPNVNSIFILPYSALRTYQPSIGLF